MKRIGHVAALWRYPVKSMRGESVQKVAFDAYGLVGDRRFAFESIAAPPGKPMLASRERAVLLTYTPKLEPEPQVQTPAGEAFILRSSELLAHLEANIAVRNSKWRLQENEKPFTDVRPVSLISTATLSGLEREFGSTLDPQRFRSNIVITFDSGKPFGEDAFAGMTLRLGATASLHVRERIPRCTIVSLDPTTAEPDRTLLRYLAHHHESRVGVYASVHTPGPVSVGDAICLQE